MSEEFEVGHELDRALRSAVTGLAQLMERAARRRAESDRAAAAETRQEWLGQRDVARQKYVPWTRPGAVEKGELEHAAKAWAVAAGWSQMDPIAKEAADDLAERFNKTHGEHPSLTLRKISAPATPKVPDEAKALLTMPAVVGLAGKHAPFYYHRHDAAAPAADIPQTESEKQLLEDWQHYAENGELPERTRWEAWAEHQGQGEAFGADQWRTADGQVDHELRDASLRRLWDEGAEERGIRELEEHQVAMAAAGMGELRPHVQPAEQASWVPLMDRSAFDAAEPAEAVAAWRDATSKASGDLAAAAASAQLAENIRQKYGVDPTSDYLLQAMTEHAATQAESRRGAEDKARQASEEAVAVAGFSAPGESVSMSAPMVAGGEISRDRALQLNSAAQEFYAAQMRPGTEGHKYVVNRLGEGALQGPWALGYAPPGWTNLTRHLQRNGVSDQEIVAAGLGELSGKGNVIDVFRNRAMVGIRGEQGEVVGFVGRDLSGDPRAPKYRNTGATPAFTKSHEVFGLTEAAPGARIVRTEGAFDAMAISLASEGRAAGVAPLGTALSDRQAQILAERAGDKVWLANDSDAAGLEATEHDFYALSRQGIDARALKVPGGDPAEAWKNDPTLLRASVANLDTAPSAAEVIVDRFVDENRDALAAGDPAATQQLEETVQLVSESMSDPIEQQLMRLRPEQIREELVRQSDEAREDAVQMDVTAEQMTAVASSSTNPEEAKRMESDAAAVQARSDVRDAAGDRLENRSAAVEQEQPEQPYDRAGEVDLSALEPDARNARIASSHGFSQPTGDAVRSTVGRTKGTAAKRGGATQQGRSRGRGLSR